MSDSGIDDIDQCILALLQHNGRISHTEIADRMDISDSTVHKRVSRLEEMGVITGYRAQIDYKKINHSELFLLDCATSVTGRDRVADECAAIHGVISVITGRVGDGNIRLIIAGQDTDDTTRIVNEIEETGVHIRDETAIESITNCPLTGSDTITPADN